MTIVLVSIIIYLVVAFIWCFIASVTTLLDTEDVFACLFWVIFIPYGVIKGLILRRKYKKALDKTKNK